MCYTRRLTIANGMCISFCNQPGTLFGYLTTVTPVCRCLQPYIYCGWRHLATSRESKAHFFGLPLVPPRDNRGKFYMDQTKENSMLVKRIAQHVPIYLQPFPSNSTCKFKSSHYFAHFGLPWVRPWDNRGKCHTIGKRIQCL